MVEKALLDQGPEPRALSGQELEEKFKAHEEKREASQIERIWSMEKHPRCALLSSPEKLDESFVSRGSDETDTLKDFEQVKRWVKKEKLQNAKWYPTNKELRDSLMQLKTSRSESGERKGHKEAISGEDQDSPPSEQEPEAGGISLKVEKEASDNDKQADCASLPSTEKLNTAMDVPGSDVTGTPRDIKRVKDNEQLEPDEFGSYVKLAFKIAFDTMRDTASPELPELAIWYYAGHGLGKETAKKLCYSSTPRLKKIGLDPKCNDAANTFVKKLENRKVQGGELCLHEVGYCDLYGLLKPWIAAVKAESVNAKGAKKNKHLVIILDSCHSGIIAQELEEFQKQAQEIDSTLLDENSVTIQAACGPDERTYGGYFTPCFVYLNENKEFLNELKVEWNNMEQEEKAKYRSIYLPSPMVVTTRSQSQDVTMEVEVQNFKLTLFQDPEFFKFCSLKVYQHQDKKLFDGKERVLNSKLAGEFMKSRNFVVLDYKLKRHKKAGTPMGLFLLKDPNPYLSICAHIHFEKGNTSIHTGINLVHHKKPPMGSTLFKEDHDDQIDSGQHKISVARDDNAEALVQDCKTYVNDKEPGRWEDVKKWNMTGKGFNKQFRLQERSLWEDSYLKRIKKFDLPEVA